MTKQKKPKIIIYYNNIKTSNLVIKKAACLVFVIAVYIKCNSQNCVVEYVGHTRLTLEKRLNVRYGSIKVNYQKNYLVTKDILKENTTILTIKSDYR